MLRRHFNLFIFLCSLVAVGGLLEAQGSSVPNLDTCSGAQIFKKYKRCENLEKPVMTPDPSIDCAVVNGRVADSRCVNTYKKVQQMRWVKKDNFEGWTGLQGRGLDQNWGCDRIREQALAYYGKEMQRDYNKSIRLTEIHRGEKSQEIKVGPMKMFKDYKYDYNCTYRVEVYEPVEVATDEVIQSVAPAIVSRYESQQNANCGPENKYSVASSGDNQEITALQEALQNGAVVPDSVSCTTCDKVAEKGTMADFANCLAEVESRFRNKENSDLWNRLTKADQEAFENQVTKIYRVATRNGGDPGLILPFSFLEAFPLPLNK